MRDPIGRITDQREFFTLDPADFYKKPIQVGEFEHLARVAKALWIHSGDPKAPHAELTSGKCSNGFVDTLRLLRFTNICQILASVLTLIIENNDDFGGSPSWVIGSDHAAATFSQNVACNFLVQHDFTSKGPGKSQIWDRFVIEPDETVLQIEELITTTGTLDAVRAGIRAAHKYPIQFAEYSAALVHRSSVYEFEGKPILYFVHYDIEVWDPDKCPLCAAGSKRFRPKQNWAELTGEKA